MNISQTTRSCYWAHYGEHNPLCFLIGKLQKDKGIKREKKVASFHGGASQMHLVELIQSLNLRHIVTSIPMILSQAHF